MQAVSVMTSGSNAVWRACCCIGAAYPGACAGAWAGAWAGATAASTSAAAMCASGARNNMVLAVVAVIAQLQDVGRARVGTARTRP